MVKKNKKSENFKKTIYKKQEEIFDDLSKNYTETVKHGKQFGKESLEKINEATISGTEFLKSQQYLKSIKEKSLKFKEKSTEQSILLKKQSPKFYKKITNAFFHFFELLIGRIKLGTQYGITNIEILEKLAKLKELGIITEKEFNDKKKKILDRI
ncbi:MAG: SHOCT domain-containing protein [Nitrosopumilus sp.]|nr:SHOCT domain-containing protein [Nitrosopumilus sp.]MBL7017699.1 SHOCT domain-containing protein [Nitrosopumilus sp.]